MAKEEQNKIDLKEAMDFAYECKEEEKRSEEKRDKKRDEATEKSNRILPKITKEIKKVSKNIGYATVIVGALTTITSTSVAIAQSNKRDKEYIQLKEGIIAEVDRSTPTSQDMDITELNDGVYAVTTGTQKERIDTTGAVEINSSDSSTMRAMNDQELDELKKATDEKERIDTTGAVEISSSNSSTMRAMNDQELDELKKATDEKERIDTTGAVEINSSDSSTMRKMTNKELDEVEATTTTTTTKLNEGVVVETQIKNKKEKINTKGAKDLKSLDDEFERLLLKITNEKESKPRQADDEISR